MRTFGAGTFSARTHAITVSPEGAVFCVDDGRHTVTKWTPEGELLMTIGRPDEPPSVSAASRSTARPTLPSPPTVASEAGVSAVIERIEVPDEVTGRP